MGGKAQAPAAPDYTPLIQASQAQAEANTKLGQEQLDWAKQQYASDKATNDQVVTALTDNMNQSTAAAAADRARYENTFVPLQDQYIQQAKDYNTPARTDFNMGQAQGAVATQFDAARKSAQQDLESYGINPSATRYGALDIGTRTQQAAATAAAGTTAAVNTENTGRALLASAIGMGSGLPAQSTTELNTANSSGTGATGTDLATTASGANTMGTSTQYSGLASSDLSAWGNAVNTGYQNQLAQFQANQQSSSGWGSALGLAGGLIAKSVFHLKDGGAVPVSTSPSGGAVPDDVNAKLSGGEFVMPPDAVRWFGEKALYGMLDKANKDRAVMQQQTGAIPNVHPDVVPAGRQSAIPLG